MPLCLSSSPRRWFSLAASLGFAALVATPAQALSSRTLFTPTGAFPGDILGVAVAGAGDVNGDGYADVIVGAADNDDGGTSAGQAYVYYGGPAADALPDLTLTGAAPFDAFGRSVAGAGDVNGDGYDDVIVGALGNDAGGTDAGRAYVFFGGQHADATADLILTGVSAGDDFGYSVHAAGDVNGDGYADVIVGAPFNDAGGANAGRAYVFYGGKTPDAIADLTLTGAAAGDNFGTSVSGAGDVSGDGFPDVIVGAPLNDAGGADAGRAYVFFGGPGADAAADVTMTGVSAGDRFGTAVSIPGSVKGYGSADVAVGDGLGGAYVFWGAPVMNASYDLGFGAGNGFAASIAGAGDVNGDGYDDLIIGAYGNDANGTDAGQAYVLFGGPGIDNNPDLTLTGERAGDFLGISVSGAGDADGDGFDDLIVGACGNDAGGPDAGRAYVVTVHPYRVVSPDGGEQWVAGRPATVRWRGRDNADLAISRDGGASWSTLVSGVGGEDENEFSLIAPGPPTGLALVRVSITGQPVTHASSDVSDGVFRIVEAVEPPAAASRLRLTPTGAAANDFYGQKVAGAGDVNGDGYPDVIVGASSNDAGGTDAGRAYVVFGGPGADAAANDFYGQKVAGAGDVNGDGYPDVIVGASSNDAGGTDAGRAYVYFGGPGADATADLTLTGTSSSDYFGSSVAGAGDVNGDGYADVIVGAMGNSAAGPGAGRAYVYLGGPSPDVVADLTLTGEASLDHFGRAVAGAGDVNGDGYGDIIVGAPENATAGPYGGRAYVYYGGLAPDDIADLTLTSEGQANYFGWAVASAGDLDADGYADVIVGAWGGDRAYVYFGGPGADAEADLTLNAESLQDEFGISVSSAGDVNGDGYPDLIVGAPGADPAGVRRGRAYVYLGGPGADAVADATFTGAAEFDSYGSSVAGAGDVSGDGFADVIVGAPQHDAAGTDAGRAYVYDFSRYFVVSPNDGEVWNVGASATVSWLGAERADLWLSVDGGRSYDLLRHDVGGSGSNLLPLLVPHAPTKFARVKVTPVDPAIRGADESDSLFTIRSSVALLTLAARRTPDGAELTWSTDPGVSPEGLAGYRLYRLGPGQAGGGTRVGPELITQSGYTDRDGGQGSTYRLMAVNGLREELELGRVSVAPAAALAAWPLPYRGGALNVSFAVGGLAGGAGAAEVALFDVNGRLVRSLVRGTYPQGYQSLTWDGRDRGGAPAPNGIYFLRSTSAGEEHRLKVVVMR